MYVVTSFGECGLYDGCTEDGCGTSDLGVPMVDETQDVSDILLLCKGTVKESGVKNSAEDGCQLIHFVTSAAVFVKNARQACSRDIFHMSQLEKHRSK